jgi:PAS domain S-box-containing protein
VHDQFLYGLTPTPFTRVAAAMKMHSHYETLSAIQHGLFVVQADAPGYPIRFVNDAFVSFTGQARDQLIGRDCALLFGDGCDPQTAEARLMVASGRRRPGALEERSSGGNSLELLSVSEISDGEHRYFIVLVDDRAVAAPSVDMGDIVHKLRGPLSACVAWVDLLGLTSADSPEIASAVAAIKRNLERERLLIDSLLDAAPASPALRESSPGGAYRS